MAFGIRRNARYLVPVFLILGALSFLGYLYSGLGQFFLTLLGPVFFLAYWLRVYGAAVTQFIPQDPFSNHFFFILPLTLLYFGFAGYQLKNIIFERSKVGLVVVVIFLAFLVYIHILAFQELSLYWSGSLPL